MVSILVIRRLRSTLRREDGFSLVELSAGMILSSMIAAALMTVFYAFSQNTSDLAATSSVQADLRSVIADQVVEIRQAVRADPDGEPVESLDASRLAFYTRNYASGEIERVVYERKECVGGECELWVNRYALSETDGGVSTFEAIPYQASLLMTEVLSDQPLFVGIEYSGEPLTAVETASCDGASIDCDFPMVGITLRAHRDAVSSGPITPIELHQEVSIRSA